MSPANLHPGTGTILFVHPPGPDRDLYVTALTEAGFDTTVETTVEAATSWLRTTGLPDVVLMELMPDPAMAWSFIERRCVDAPGLPLVILTSMVRPDRLHRRRARALGCAAFVAKPCSLAQLVDVASQVRRGIRGLEISTYVGPG